MMNKRGQELSTNAIIMIVIGLIVLVVLVLGFTMGWNKLLPFVSTNNVQNIVSGCQTACATGNIFDYCTLDRTLKAEDLEEDLVGTCQELSSDQYARYGIDTCATIQCPAEETP